MYPASVNVVVVFSGRIQSIDSVPQHISLSLKKSSLQSHQSDLLFSELSIGQIISGIVKSTQDFGVFIQIKDTNMVGLCHISQV